MRVKRIKTKRLLLAIRHSYCYLYLDGKPIGEIVYSKGNVGYSMYANEHKQKGYMTEAMRALMHYMRVSKRFSYAFAYARIANEASNKILRKFFGEPYAIDRETNLYGVWLK